MRKRYLSFLLSLIIFLTSFTPAFADSVEVLEPIMSGVESSKEERDSSDSVFVLDSRDNNGKVIENKEKSSVSTPNILEERNNKVENKKVENIKDIVNPVKPQIEKLSERKAPSVKNTVNEKETLNEGLEVSEPMGGGSCYWSRCY